MMNDQASESEEEDSKALRRKKKSLFGFQILSSKQMRQSMASTVDNDT